MQHNDTAVCGDGDGQQVTVSVLHPLPVCQQTPRQQQLEGSKLYTLGICIVSLQSKVLPEPKILIFPITYLPLTGKMFES